MTDTVYVRDPLSAGAASLLFPGLGQWLQGRRWAAVYFFVDALAGALLGAFVPEMRMVFWTAAAAICVWAVLDAGFAARQRGAWNRAYGDHY
jgi:hypothetical protein